VRRVEAEIRHRRPNRTLLDGALLILRNLAERTRTRPALAALRHWIRAAERERDGHRMPYVSTEVIRASEQGGGLDRFDPWVRVDNHEYRVAPLTRGIGETLSQLERFEENRRRRLEGTRRLLQLGLTPSSLQVPGDAALFRVPLFVHRREQALAYLAHQGLHPDYIYDPPLDCYASPEIADRLPSPEAAQAWSRDVLPVDPLQADRFLAILARSPGLLSPVPPRTG
jgi:hypothetical protein